jgi:hypothetical protein
MKGMRNTISNFKIQISKKPEKAIVIARSRGHFRGTTCHGEADRQALA